MPSLFIFASEEPNKFFLPGDINEFYWGLAAFTIVFGLIVWKLVPLAAKGLSDKADTVADELATAEKAQVDADAEAQALLAKLGDADADAETIVTDARQAASKYEADSAAKAVADADALKVRVQAEIDSAKAQASAELGSELSKSALEAAEAVVADNLDAESQARLIEQYISQVGAGS